MFKENFLKDWHERMTPDERRRVREMDRCDFRQIHDYLVQQVKEGKERYKTRLTSNEHCVNTNTS